MVAQRIPNRIHKHQRRQRGNTRNERRRQQPTKHYEPPRVRHLPLMVAQRIPNRIHKHQRRQRGNTRNERRRQQPTKHYKQPRARHFPCLVAERRKNRIQSAGLRRLQFNISNPCDEHRRQRPTKHPKYRNQSGSYVLAMTLGTESRVTCIQTTKSGRRSL